MQPFTFRALISAYLSSVKRGGTFQQVDTVDGVAMVDCVEQQVVALELGQLNFIHKYYNPTFKEYHLFY